MFDLNKNSGTSQQLSLIASKFKVAQKQIKDNLALGLQSDGTATSGALTAKQITGLAATLKDDTVSYGGISKNDFAEWVAIVKNNPAGAGTNRDLTLNLMQSAIGAATEDNAKPSVVCSRQDVFDEGWALYQPHQRMFSEEMNKLGFPGVLMFNGLPWIVSSFAPANSIQFIAEEFVFLCVHRNDNLRSTTIGNLETSHSQLTRITWMGNLVCNNRRHNALLNDIEVAS